ncbi:hypothetical protein IWX49DRAFT_292467 [Phyllosticta citricarpa]
MFTARSLRETAGAMDARNSCVVRFVECPRNLRRGSGAPGPSTLGIKLIAARCWALQKSHCSSLRHDPFPNLEISLRPARKKKKKKPATPPSFSSDVRALCLCCLVSTICCRPFPRSPSCRRRRRRRRRPSAFRLPPLHQTWTWDPPSSSPPPHAISVFAFICPIAMHPAVHVDCLLLRRCSSRCSINCRPHSCPQEKYTLAPARKTAGPLVPPVPLV